MKKRYPLGICVVAGLAVALFYIVRSDSVSESSEADAIVSDVPPSMSNAEAPLSPQATSLAEQAESVEEPIALPPTDTVKQTRRMVAAHASLRAPEVADPDSDTNKRIMQKMVMQAFENAESNSRK